MFTLCKSETTGLSFNFNKGYLTQWVWNNGDGSDQISNGIKTLVAVQYTLTYACDSTILSLQIIGEEEGLTYSINGVDYQQSFVFDSVPNGTITLRIKNGNSITPIPIVVLNDGSHCIEPVFEQITMLSLICLSDDPIFQTLNIAGC